MTWKEPKPVRLRVRRTVLEGHSPRNIVHFAANGMRKYEQTLCGRAAACFTPIKRSRGRKLSPPWARDAVPCAVCIAAASSPRVSSECFYVVAPEFSTPELRGARANLLAVLAARADGALNVPLVEPTRCTCGCGGVGTCVWWTIAGGAALPSVGCVCIGSDVCEWCVGDRDIKPDNVDDFAAWLDGETFDAATVAALAKSA